MSPRNLDLPLLRTLVAIADRRSFALAARDTFKTQSAVTQQMRKLEEIAGQPLFEKQGRTKHLTAEGRRLLDYARGILALHDEALRSLRAAGPPDVLRLGGLQDVTGDLLPRLLSHLAAEHPELRVEIHIGRSRSLNAMLKRGELDIALQTRRDDRLRAARIRTSPVVWLCADGFEWDKTQPLPLIAGDETSQCRRLALAALDTRGIPWRLAYTASGLGGIQAAVRAGLGVTARNVELLDDGMKILGEADGLPRLPALEFHLAIRRETLDARTLAVYELLARAAAEPPPAS